MQRSVSFVGYGSCTLSCSLRLNFARSLLIFCLVRSVFETRSSASTSSSIFILTEEDLCSKPAFVRADSQLKYQAICFSIKQSVLYRISGRSRLKLFIWEPISEAVDFILVSSHVQHTSRRYLFAF